MVLPLFYNAFRPLKWILYGIFLCHISNSHAFTGVTLIHHHGRQPCTVTSTSSQPKDLRKLSHIPQQSTNRQSRRFMSTKGVSKTGGRLLESTEDYRQLVLDGAMDRPILVFWTAPWCGPCRLSIPVVKDIMHLYSDQMETVEVCTDDLPDLVADAGVVSIPTIHIYFQGRLVDTLVGCVAKQVLAGSVEKVLEDIQLRQAGGGGQFLRPRTLDILDDFSP